MTLLPRWHPASISCPHKIPLFKSQCDLLQKWIHGPLLLKILHRLPTALWNKMKNLHYAHGYGSCSSLQPHLKTILPHTWHFINHWEIHSSSNIANALCIQAGALFIPSSWNALFPVLLKSTHFPPTSLSQMIPFQKTVSFEQPIQSGFIIITLFIYLDFFCYLLECKSSVRGRFIHIFLLLYSLCLIQCLVHNLYQTFVE